MKRTILLLVGFFFVWQFGFAQKAVITGTIISKEDGLPIIGASVVEKGTTNGTITNFDGVYTISVSPNATLLFSYVGMEKTERKVSGTSTLNIELVSNAISIDEVVVTALGVTRAKKALGYAVQDVQGDELAKVKSQNVVSSLSGRVSGVQITTATGQMGGGQN